MAAGPLLLILGITLSLLAWVESTDNVFVVAPNIFNANEQETVSVLVINGDQQAAVTVTVQSNGQIHDTTTKAVTKGTQEKFSVRVDATKLGTPASNGQHYIQLRVQCPRCRNFDRSTDILVDKRTGTVFLRTDKPLYLPGQTVTIQVFAVDEVRKPANMPIKVEIKNPKGVIISRKTERIQTGLFRDEFKISSRPLHGFWKIAIHFGANYSESRERQIEIKKYVLPHFQVKITKYPEYVDSLTTRYEGSFEARYSFNANVVGKARVVFRVVTGSDATYLIDKSYQRLDFGHAEFTLEAADMKTLNMNDLMNSKSHLQIEVIVTETSTGISERAVAPRCYFDTSPYIISFDGTIANFMPGLPFIVKITVSTLMGVPVPHKRLEVSITGQHNQLMKSANNEGVITLYLNIRQNIRTIRINVNVEGDLKKTEHVIHKANMPGYMMIRPSHAPTLQPGETIPFEAVFSDSSNYCKLQFMLVSGGRIFDVGHEEKRDTSVLSFNRHISYDNAPSVRIVSWYFRENDNQLVAASTKIQVERKCSTKAEVKRAEREPTFLDPGATCDMIYKGTIGAKVFTMVVDKSVYFLNNGSRLTPKTFFDEFESRDLGCAVGGGANATDVFALAGLTVLTDSFRHPRRESGNCTQTATSAGRRRRSTVAKDPDEKTCCTAGEQFANTTEIALTSQRRHISCFRGAANYTGRSCKNSFGKCCVESATTRAKEGQDNSRSGPNSGDDYEARMIENESVIPSRTDFSESWFISNLEISASGETRRKITLPGSITTWVFQAVTMSNTEGMCVAEPYEQVVRKEIFLKLHLPYTAVQGEQLELAATVYNLQNSDLYNIKVSFLSVEGLCSDAVAGTYSKQEHHRLKGKNSWTARWPIVPMQSGRIEITVKLFTMAGSDSVTRFLTVVPSGELVVAPMLQITQDPSGEQSFRQAWNGTVGSLKYTARRDIRRQMQTTTVPLKLPPDALSGTASIKVSLLGDVMTPLIEDFVNGTEKYLIRPFGCGSQTMAKLGPLIFAARYLQHKGKLNGELKEKTIEKITEGIHIVKEYQVRDGGFVVYNYAAARPSLWLTAFAVKTFSHVREPINIENKVIDDAITWLISQRNNDTGFFSGETIHSATQVTLETTAYVYIALVESGYYTKHKSEMNAALNTLAERVATENDPFTLAIVTYVLAKYRHPDRYSINERLLSRATNLTDSQPMQTSWSRYTYYTEMDVETAGYALLAQVALGRIIQSAPIVEWLVRQRYGGSQYRNTQSTVVALQALVEYSLRAQKNKLDMNCTLSYLTIPNPSSHTFTLNEANKLVQQREEVTAHIDKPLSMVCKGKGVIHMAVETTYYSIKSQAENCAFNITAQATLKDGKRWTIEVCSRVKEALTNLSMPMLEVGIGTGFTPDNTTLENLIIKNLIDLYEVNDRAVVLYVKKIPSNRELCLTFDVIKGDGVNRILPVPVKVYAYYEPDTTSCRTFYHPLGKNGGMLDVRCDPSSQKWCKCLENNCPKCYGHHSLDQKAATPLQTDEELTDHACNKPYINYVFNGTIQDVVNRNGEVRYTVNIDTVAKQGTEPRVLVEGNQRVFSYATKCMHCPLEIGRRYVIMGEDEPVKDGAVMEYSISRNTYIMPLYGKGDKKKRMMNSTERRVNSKHKKILKALKTNSCQT